MLSLLSSIVLRSMHERAEFHDHLKDNADRYISPTRAQKRGYREPLLPFRSFW